MPFETDQRGSFDPGAGSGYRIEHVHGCRLVFGSFPIRKLSTFTEGLSERAQIATDISDRVGASLVIGEPEDLEKLRKLDLPLSRKRLADVLAAREMGLERVADWLRDGDRGASSNAMCKQLYGVPEDAGFDHPRDPADLRRCVLFLDATGAQDRIRQVGRISCPWAALVEIWEPLTATLKDEMREGEGAPRTYALMREAIRRCEPPSDCTGP